MNVPTCGLQWTWNFGDGKGGSSAQNPPYAYSKQGQYNVTLLVTNSAGSNSVTQRIRVTAH